MYEEVYLDAHSATAPRLDIVEGFASMVRQYWASPHAPYFLGAQQVYPLQKHLGELFSILGAGKEDQMFFSKGSSDSLYQVLLHTYTEVTRQTGKTLFLHAAIEEDAQLVPLRYVEQWGCLTKEVPVNAYGQMTPECLEKSITLKTALCTCTWANPLTGVIQPVRDLAEVCRKKGVRFHVDASTIVGKRFVCIEDLQVDAFSLDGSLLYGLPGTGLTMVSSSSSIQWQPPEELPLAAFVSLKDSIRYVQEQFEGYGMEQARLRDLLEAEVKAGIPDVVFPFAEADRLPNTSVMVFPLLYAEALLYLLHAKGIYATKGGGRLGSLSAMLQKLGWDRSLAEGALSFSLPLGVCENEVLYAATEIVRCVQQLQKVAGR